MTKEEFTTILNNIELNYNREEQKLCRQFVNENRRFNIGNRIKYKKFYGKVIDINYSIFVDSPFPEICYRCIQLEKDGTVPKLKRTICIYDCDIKD